MSTILRPTLIISLLLSFLSAEWVVKINDKTVNLAAFQSYIDVQKQFSGMSNSSIDALVSTEEKALLLNNFIDLQLILMEAEKKGYSRKTQNIKNAFLKKVPEFKYMYFMSKEIQKKSGSMKITENSLRSIFNRVNNNPKLKFEQLQAQQLEQLKNQAILEETVKLKKAYQKQIEKKYKVFRGPIKSQVIASVGKKAIKKDALEKEMSKQLSMIGISKAQFQKEKPKLYEQQMLELRDDMILRELVSLEMKNQNFDKKPDVKLSLNMLYDQIILEEYVKDQVISKIDVTMQELDEAYKQVKDNPQVKNAPYPEVKKYLTAQIKEQKKELRLNSLLTELKEESRIIRNKEALKKIK